MLSSGGSTNVACGVTCVWALKNASVEGPDQTLQLSRLAGIHAHWTASIAAESVDDIGPRVSAVEVDSHPANYHLTCESPLFRAPKSLVPTDASALQAHKAVFLSGDDRSPTGDWRSFRCAEIIRDCSFAGTGRARGTALLVAPNVQAEVSMTEPGQASSSDAVVGAIHVHGRNSGPAVLP